jgi:hypothetical protein
MSVAKWRNYGQEEFVALRSLPGTKPEKRTRSEIQTVTMTLTAGIVSSIPRQFCLANHQPYPDTTFNGG